MSLTFKIQAKTYPTRGSFTISRSSISQIEIVEVQISDGDNIGRGECRPYPRYGDSVKSVSKQLEGIRPFIQKGDFNKAINQLPPGPARNAVDCAWLDFRAKQNDVPVWTAFDLPPPTPRETAFTLSWASPNIMADAAIRAADHKFLKLKIGENGLDHVKAITAARPDAKLIIDANEALTLNALETMLNAFSNFNIALIEQPLPAGHVEHLPSTHIPICADEGLHTVDDLPELWRLGYRAVNVKLDKCGGLTAGVKLMQDAKDIGFLVMAGCMVSTSLAMAPMMIAESLCDVIDLDGPLLLSKDIENGLNYNGAIVHPPNASLWG